MGITTRVPNRVEGLGLVFAGCVCTVGALAFGALGDLPGAPAADLTMAPPASIAAALSAPSRNNGSFSSRSSTSSSCVG